MSWSATSTMAHSMSFRVGESDGEVSDLAATGMAACSSIRSCSMKVRSTQSCTLGLVSAGSV
jgi:hypothetical protein